MEKHLKFTVLFNAMLGLSFMNIAQAESQSKTTYEAKEQITESAYKVAKEKCDLLDGNNKDVCIEEAKATEKKEKARAKAEYKNTVGEWTDYRVDCADADYSVATERCNAKSGNDKDVCNEEAKAMHTKAVDIAKANKVIGELKNEVRQDAQKADYKVAKEKCDALSGNEKDQCIASAKIKYQQ